MLQDPRPIKPLQHALCDMLEQLGIEFLPSQWQMQESLLTPHEHTELALLQGYLDACGVPHQIFKQVGADEVKHLGPYTLAMGHNGQTGSLQELLSGQDKKPPLLWALQLEGEGLQTAAPAQPTEPPPVSLLNFWRKLRDSKWLREAMQFDNGNFKPVVYASLLINILALAGPLFSLQVYDRIIPNQAYASLAALLAGVALCLGFEHFLKHARHRLMEFAATSIDTRCTSHLSQSLLNVPVHKTEPSVLLQHLRSFEQLRELITGVFLLALIDLPFLVLFLGVITLIHPVFLLVSGGVILLTLLLVVHSHRCLSCLGQEQMKQSRQTQSQWLDSLACLDNIQAHGVQQAHSKLLNNLQLKSRMGGNAVRDQLFKVNQSIQLLQQGGWIFTIALGVYLIVEKQLTVGGLIAVSMLTMRCFAPIQKLQGHLVQTHSAQASFEELDQFLGQQPKTQATRAALKGIEHIGIESASVVKPGQSPESRQIGHFILRHITLELKPGDRVGIIGPTGSGKTSILKLLARQLACDAGHLAVNHLAIDHYHPGEYNSKIGYATQPPSLIRGTLLENIRFNRPHIDTNACWSILDALGLKKWVEQHPDGIHMRIENQGNNLSSGQKQSISLCRALVGQPELVLLDEPTVCLDQYMETRLIQYLQQLSTRQILVFTTHKLNLLSCAHSLILMNNSQIDTQGEKAKVLHQANTLAKQRDQQPGAIQ
ncbi:MAG: ATP-binding cassette domain-containing protein [Limnobacter sp.]|uniref:ATP-binding cassette domain-containing protein n=1 Tax=Limnobacter sp. TaxID=2003368 RepID=UPI0022C4CD14|nr:ATP-binding cassette domain-containing protein [Limnobacter sp.]MCZ8015480.1 ATP-binding cassette domain-containing protein [Limnobacter sp.]